MKITYDPAADAIYVQLKAIDTGGRPGETTVNEDGVIVDTIGDGSPRGFEFLSVRSSAARAESLPEMVSLALADFIASGALESKSYVEREYA